MLNMYDWTCGNTLTDIRTRYWILECMSKWVFGEYKHRQVYSMGVM